MSEETPAHDLIERIRTGDSQASEQLFSRYAQRLVRLAERQLSRGLAGRLDGEDVVQSALRSFFNRDAQGKFSIDDSTQLWRLLVKITVDKARAKARHHTAQARDVGAEAQGGHDHLAATLARGPSPDEAVVLIDEIDAVLKGLPEIHGDILRRRLEGASVAETATALRVSRQTVYRSLQLLQQRLAKRAPAPSS